MYRVGFVGAGKMGGAIAARVVEAGVLDASQVGCCSKSGVGANELRESCGVCVEEGVEDLVSKSDVVVLGFKPQQLGELSGVIAKHIEGKVVVSILAGVGLETLGEMFQGARLIVRAMPSLTVVGGYGTMAYVYNREPGDEDRELIERMFGALGKVYLLKEEQIDNYTGICGCGPGFVFEWARGMEEAAREMGFEGEVAREMVLETILGSARLMEDSGGSFEELRNSVASKGGATQAGLDVLESKGLSEVVKEATVAARNKCIELGKSV